ncbi:hypothetical protein KJ937_04310 [Patescibacteria group bacterium]|nr:hypothetical protein [Patescibacteria group bacterium]MBU2509593.1 hypothetical protein [Patescibacteria group bacterium]
MCSPTFSSDEEWCTAAEDMELYICPEGLNVCTSDHNQCGYDLPEGEDYVPPDAECKKFIDGDTWVDEDADQGKALSEYDENGQLEVGFGVLSHSAPYFSNFKVSGKKIVWNRGNADSYESAEGEFGSDCEQITMRYYKGGKGDEIQPWLTRVIVWLHK